MPLSERASEYNRARQYLEELGPISVQDFKRMYFNEGLFAVKGEEWIKQGLITPEAPRRRKRFRVHRRRDVFVIFRRVPDAEYVEVASRGRKPKVLVVYFKDKRGQLHKRGKNGQFQHFTVKERRLLHLGVNKSRPSQAKKGPE